MLCFLFFSCSTVAASINALATVTFEDFVKSCFPHISDKKSTWISKGLCRYSWWIHVVKYICSMCPSPAFSILDTLIHKQIQMKHLKIQVQILTLPKFTLLWSYTDPIFRCSFVLTLCFRSITSSSSLHYVNQRITALWLKLFLKTHWSPFKNFK